MKKYRNDRDDPCFGNMLQNRSFDFAQDDTQPGCLRLKYVESGSEGDLSTTVEMTGNAWLPSVGVYYYALCIMNYALQKGCVSTAFLQHHCFSARSFFALAMRTQRVKVSMAVSSSWRVR